MKTKKQIETFNRQRASSLEQKCEHKTKHNCRIAGARYCDCPCKISFFLETIAYESCIPKDFWYFSEDEVKENTDIFDQVKEYVAPENIHQNLKEGYGLFLYGANGSGKTSFLSWLAMTLIRKTNYSVYYTTTMDLYYNITKSFSDSKRNPEDRVLDRLENYLGETDFVIIDELLKERHKEGDSFTRVFIEKWLRYRYDNGLPVLLASNASLSQIRAPAEEGGYGETIGSLITGRLRQYGMEDVDFRKIKAKEMYK